MVDDGRIAEAGSHAELMAADGGHAELYRLQERAYSWAESVNGFVY